jgi:hypothetical protein
MRRHRVLSLAGLLFLAAVLASCSVREAPTAASLTPVAIQMDLSRLSDTMAYARMFEIVHDPGEYLGKTARIQGTYVPVPDPAREGLYYHFLLVADITGCCEIGIEFFLDGRRYPEDYPPEYARIELEGVFDMATVSGNRHICLKAEKIRVIWKAEPVPPPVP